MPAPEVAVAPRAPLRTRAARLVGAVALLGVLSGLWLYASYNGTALLEHRPPPISLGDALGSGLMDWVLWLPAWPLAVLVARRWPFRRGALGRAVGAHVVAAPLLSLLQLALFALASVALRAVLYDQEAGLTTGAIVARALADAFTAKFKSGILVAALALIALQAYDHWRAARAGELRAAELARALAESRLTALRAALEPHFRFNSLHTIQALVRAEPVTAERMIARLGELLRASLATTGRAEVPLAEELALLESYLELERERFGARLRFALDVPEEALAARVPALLLQPLAENAVRHGLSRRTGEAALRLSVQRSADRLRIKLCDEGPGFASSGSRTGHGIGLASVRARLEALADERASLRVRPGPQGGTEVEIELPFRAESPRTEASADGRGVFSASMDRGGRAFHERPGDSESA